MADNRRSATRHDVDLPATLAVGAGPAETCAIKNLSLGGALLDVRKLAMGERVVLTFRIPTLEDPIKSAAVVRWTSDGSIGVQFDGLRARDVWALGKYFETL